MKFEDIREFTYIDNIVIINGEQYEIKESLEDGIYAVQYHKETGLTLEEPKFNVVPFSKYSFCLVEWEKEKEKAEAEPEAVQNETETENTDT